MDPQFLFVHLWRVAAEHVHAQGRLQVSQVQLGVPPLSVKLRELVFADLFRVEHRGDEYATTHLNLSYRELIGKILVLLFVHPLRPSDRLGPRHYVVTRAERLTAAKVGGASPILGEHDIDARRHLRRNQEVVAVKRISQQDIASNKSPLQAPQQSQLAVAFAAKWSHRRVDHRAGRQANHSDESGDREADSRGLRSQLRENALVIFGVRHRNPGTVDQLDRTAVPAPSLRGPLAQHPAALTGQGLHHSKRQTLAALAVRSGAGAAFAQALRLASHRPPVDRLLARSIGIQGLAHEDRQRDRRRKQPFAMLGQMLLRYFQQLRTRERIEKIHCLDAANRAANTSLMLLAFKLGITIAQDWPLGYGGWCVVTTSYQSRRPVFLYVFNPLARSASTVAA